MKHFAPEYPFWSRRSAELFVLAVAPNQSFSVSRDGDIWWISLPGRGLIECESMETCETVAARYVLAADEDNWGSDEAYIEACDEDDRAYGDRRFQDARDRLGRTV